MVHLKTKEELQLMRDGGRILREVVKEIIKDIKEGTQTEYIDKRARDLIVAKGAETSFDKVPGYSWATCISINEQIVHTPPSKRIIKDGDIVTVDIGVFYRGFHTDFATTVLVGAYDEYKASFLEKGKEVLRKALTFVKNGQYIGEISQCIEQEMKRAGLKTIVRLTGHGVGRDLHEEPSIPQFLEGQVEKTYKMRPGLVIAVEVMYSETTHNMKHEDGDDWSLVTDDGSLSAQFEHTIALTEKNAVILT